MVVIFINKASVKNYSNSDSYIVSFIIGHWKTIPLCIKMIISSEKTWLFIRIVPVPIFGVANLLVTLAPYPSLFFSPP